MLLTLSLFAAGLQNAPPPVIPIVPPAPRSQAQPPPPASKARRATTRDVQIWARQIQQAYPAQALRDGIEGTVGVRVEVTPEGMATNCMVTSSSGSQVLDATACIAMQSHARFNPALDHAGQPTQGAYSMRITYRMPQSAPPNFSPLPPPPPPPPSSISQEKAVEARNEMRWMRRINNVYPPQALREGWEGVVGVRVIVGENGRTDSCSVTLKRPSGPGRSRLQRHDPMRASIPHWIKRETPSAPPFQRGSLTV